MCNGLNSWPRDAIALANIAASQSCSRYTLPSYWYEYVDMFSVIARLINSASGTFSQPWPASVMYRYSVLMFGVPMIESF